MARLNLRSREFGERDCRAFSEDFEELILCRQNLSRKWEKGRRR